MQFIYCEILFIVFLLCLICFLTLHSPFLQHCFVFFAVGPYNIANLLGKLFAAGQVAAEAGEVAAEAGEVGADEVIAGISRL